MRCVIVRYRGFREGPSQDAQNVLWTGRKVRPLIAQEAVRPLGQWVAGVARNREDRDLQLARLGRRDQRPGAWRRADDDDRVGESGDGSIPARKVSRDRLRPRRELAHDRTAAV